MNIDKFRKLDFGDVITNMKTNKHWAIHKKINDNVIEVVSLEYFGKTDYININTCDDYEFGDI